MKPTIGRIVHYQFEEGDQPRAAIITDIVTPDLVSLFVMGCGSSMHANEIPFSATPKPGHWSWPPREEIFQPVKLDPRRVTVIP